MNALTATTFAPAELSAMEQWALAYAKKGLKILPVEPNGKAPIGSLVPKGFHDATTNETKIREWWSKFPNADIGMACKDSHILAIDLDRTVVDDVAVRRFVRHLQKNTTYGGALLSDTLPQNRFAEVFRRFTTRPGSVLERSDGSKAVQIRNARDVLKDHLHKFSRETAYHDFEMVSRAVFGDDKIKAFIKRNLGEKTLKTIEKPRRI